MNAFTHYLVVDLEATCDEHHRIPREETEIIEIGAVLVDAESLAPVEEFQTFVRPVRHRTLTPFCIRLTTIRQADVDGAPRFHEALMKLRAMVAGRAVRLASWGAYDRDQLARDARRHGIALPFGSAHTNIKDAFVRLAGEGRGLGTVAALRRVGLRFEGTHHRGIDDARNIARLLPYALGRKPIPATRMEAHR
jgi:inhibitor of KinA sporulation pathway (predicted exonuclease)